MFILFRCSAGGKLGWGNLKRLEILFEYLKNKKDFKYLFVINSALEVKKYLESKNIKYICVNNYNEKKKIQKFQNIDLSIIELLNCSPKIQKYYKEISNRLVVLDDITKNYYISDILISCQKKDFKIYKNKSCKFYNDYKYFPVHKSFNNFLIKKKNINKIIKKITIFLGGSIYDKFYMNIANKLKKYDYNVTFLIGLENSLKLKNKIKKLSNQFTVEINSKNLAKVIFNSDIVISGGGYTKIETAYLKTPFICIPIHEHQKLLIKNFYKFLNLNIKFENLMQKSNLVKTINSFSYKKRLKISKNLSNKFKKNGIHEINKIINAK